MRYTEDRVRITATLKPDMVVHMDYWATKHRISVNQYLADAVAKFVAWETADHTKPTRETDRTNTCVSAIDGLGQAVIGLQKSVDAGFDALALVTRGDSAFLAPEDGDLDKVVMTKQQISRQKAKKKRGVK